MISSRCTSTAPTMGLGEVLPQPRRASASAIRMKAVSERVLMALLQSSP